MTFYLLPFSSLATPKSPNLQFPCLSNMMLAGFTIPRRRKDISPSVPAGWREGAGETWLNRIQSPSQTLDNIQQYYTKLLYPNELFLHYTYQTQFRRLLLLKKLAACSTIHKGISLDIYTRNHSMGECRLTSIRNGHSAV